MEATGWFSTSVGETEVVDHGRVVRRGKEVDAALLSLAVTDFEGLFCLEELDYDDFRQFCSTSNLRGSCSYSEGCFVSRPFVCFVVSFLCTMCIVKMLAISNHKLCILFCTFAWKFFLPFSCCMYTRCCGMLIHIL